MTVITGKPNYSYPKPSSTANSDTESLHLGSASTTDTESLNEEPVTTRRIYKPPPVRITHFEELPNVKKSGKKKLRRYQNRCILQTLNEEDEELDVGILEDYRSPFTRLFEDDSAMACWHEFIGKSEEEQARIMKALSKRFSGLLSKDDKFELGKPGRISSRLRRTIKIRKNLSLDIVRICEEDLITFFKTTPSEVYVKIPPTSFDRLLIHAIAQYHQLQSTSMPAENGHRRSVQVYNTIDNWVPAEDFITEFIRELRK